MVLLMHLTLLLRLASGLFSLFLGDWSKRKLKFAALAISTSAAFIAFVMMMLAKNTCILSHLSCEAAYLYQISTNIAFIIFHLAIARDANKFRKNDRRMEKLQQRGNDERYREAA